MLTAVGRRTIDAIAFLGDVVLIAGRSFLELPGFFRSGFRPVARVLLKQVLFTGVHAWAIIVVLFFLLGGLVMSQVIGFAGVGGAPLTGKILVWVVVRELGPLITAMIVIARSGAAIAAELASMKLNGELGVLEGMGIPVARYLVMPRVVGVAGAVAVLALYAEVVAIAGGFLTGSMAWGISFLQYREGIVPLFTMREIGLSLSKSFVFGGIVAAVCCRQGLSAEGGPTQIPVAATKGVMRSLLLVFLVDAFVAVATSITVS